MIVLAMQEAHDASAVIMKDGVIIAGAQEERYTGLKGDYGYPEKSISHCLKAAGINSDDIDFVALSSKKWNPVLTKIKRNANFSMNDWVMEQHDYWYHVLLKGKSVKYYDLYRDRKEWRYDDTYPMDHLLGGYMDEKEMKKMEEIRIDTVSKKLGIPKDRIQTVVHEDCHTFYSYFGSPLRGRVAALTAEGIGDYSNGTVSIFDEKGRKELASTRENHLGHIYQYITLLLGMKPAQHEYKVMGLAPYANTKEQERSYKVFKDILKVEGLNIVYDRKPEDLYFWFREKLEGHRFDGIAGGLQQFLDSTLSKWAAICIKETGLSKIVFSGGVAQNIKACKSISELDGVDDLYVCPAAGDTSLPIGACYYMMHRHLTEKGLPVDMIKPLDNIYLGPSFSNDEIDDVLKEQNIRSKYDVDFKVSPEHIAKMLADGLIVARCSGGMEFGLRALGNRSILADPRHPQTVTKINQQIKFRDFWMPFTPTILYERERDYIINPKNLKSPFMTLAFDSTKLAQKELIAALHPADLTARPQILEEWRNPLYYGIIKEFEKKTGVGGVLNTSFNLHGLPIVLGPIEALYTFENSELDALLLEDYLIRRK